MSLTEAVRSVFSKYATFTGRARRSEYWYFTLFNCIVSLVIYLIFGLLLGMPTMQSIVSGLYSLAIIIPALAVCWRRLHDIGKSGANYLLILIPIVGFILLLIWFCRDSMPGENQYGPNPKEVADYTEASSF